MKNTNELRGELVKVFNDLKSGAISPVIAGELNNAVGKIINSVKLDLEYAALRKEKPEINFLKNTK